MMTSQFLRDGKAGRGVWAGPRPAGKKRGAGWPFQPANPSRISLQPARASSGAGQGGAGRAGPLTRKKKKIGT